MNYPDVNMYGSYYLSVFVAKSPLHILPDISKRITVPKIIQTSPPTIRKHHSIMLEIDFKALLCSCLASADPIFYTMYSTCMMTPKANHLKKR